MRWHCLEVRSVPSCRPWLSFKYPLNTRLFVVHFVSDRRLPLAESHSSGIRFVPGNLIRFHGGFHSSKVVAKLQNSRVFSSGYRCYENVESSLHSVHYALTVLAHRLEFTPLDS